MMDLLIETLTGAAFELRVSSYETVISVKAKIQREEGIPISQQHLIWQNHELTDDTCLNDYKIPSGATIKLVLGMRGGPINTRRVSLAGRPNSSIGQISAGSSKARTAASPPSPGQTPPAHHSRPPVTLLILKGEGDQLNFLRIVDRGDGTLTPLAESLSAGSRPGYSTGNEEEDSEPDDCLGRGGPCLLPAACEGGSGRVDQISIKDKLQMLQWRMDQLKLAKERKSDGHKGKTTAPQPSLPSLTRVPGEPPEHHRFEVLDNPASTKPVQHHQPSTSTLPTLQAMTARFMDHKAASMSHALRNQNYPPRHFTSQRINDFLPASSDQTQLHSRLLHNRTNLPRQSTTTLPPVLIHRSSPSPLVPVPPITAPKKTQSKRCAECNKRTGLASSYPCRCGNNYCSRHRYAEAHECLYDYKTEGRRFLQETNPLITASKLPKI